MLKQLQQAKMITLGKTLICLAIALLFGAYANFAPTALGSDLIAGYVKNHFVREIIFGIALAAITISLTVSARSKSDVLKIGLMGSIVVLPFWIAAALGWSTGGLEEVWGGRINANAAYMLHASQVFLFYCGVAILASALPSIRIVPTV